MGAKAGVEVDMEVVGVAGVEEGAVVALEVRNLQFV